MNLIPLKKTKEEKEELRQLDVFVRETVLSDDRYKKFADRLSGVILPLQQVSVRDRMQVLIGGGHVREEHTKAWSKVRNTHVHPRRDFTPCSNVLVHTKKSTSPDATAASMARRSWVGMFE